VCTPSIRAPFNYTLILFFVIGAPTTSFYSKHHPGGEEPQKNEFEMLLNAERRWSLNELDPAWPSSRAEQYALKMRSTIGERIQYQTSTTQPQYTRSAGCLASFSLIGQIQWRFASTAAFVMRSGLGIVRITYSGLKAQTC